MIDYLSYLFVISFCKLINLLPLSLQQSFFTYLLKLFIFFSSKYQKIICTNLGIVFPDLSPADKKRLMYKSCSDLACTIVDSLRAGRLDHKWFIANVDFPDKEKCMKIIEQAKPKGCIVVAGHLGSFEFMPAAFYAHTLQESRVIARSFKNSYLNTWINSRRSESGVGVIERSGAMKKILASLKNGTHVGILFDQNVTRNLAVFVSWFGVPAATTKALGYAAVRLAVPVLVLNIARAENGRYRLELENLPLDTVLQQEELSFDEKVEKVTALATAEFEKYLLANPTGWFWMHRRWKTRPAENDPSIY